MSSPQFQITAQILSMLQTPTTPVWAQPASFQEGSVSTFEEVGSAPISHFISCIHIGHQLGEGAHDGAGLDSRWQVNLPTPENPIGQVQEESVKD